MSLTYDGESEDDGIFTSNAYYTIRGVMVMLRIVMDINIYRHHQQRYLYFVVRGKIILSFVHGQQ